MRYDSVSFCMAALFGTTLQHRKLQKVHELANITNELFLALVLKLSEMGY